MCCHAEAVVEILHALLQQPEIVVDCIKARLDDVELVLLDLQEILFCNFTGVYLGLSFCFGFYFPTGASIWQPQKREWLLARRSYRHVL